MGDLIAYLESNGFYPRREEIEAILRRCDHDGNRLINYEEFCEAIGQLADDSVKGEEMKDSAEEDVVEEAPVSKEFASPDAKQEAFAVNEELEGQVLSAEKTLHKSDLEVKMEPPMPKGDIKTGGEGIQADEPPKKTKAEEGVQPDVPVQHIEIVKGDTGVQEDVAPV